MSRPLVCDNPACETLVSPDQLTIVEDDGPLAGAHFRPHGWLLVSEIDGDGDDVVLGECCSRACAAALLTMETAD